MTSSESGGMTRRTNARKTPKIKAAAKHEADAKESPAKKPKKATTKKNKKKSLRTNRKGKKTNYTSKYT